MVKSCLTIVILAVMGSHVLADQAHELSFEERIRAQEAIERIYYSHLIGANRPFEEAFPRTAIAEKVRTFLERSAALEEAHHAAITDAILSREMERMEAESPMPDRLREIHEALGNDPFLIRECLVRPILTDQMAREQPSGDVMPAQVTARIGSDPIMDSEGAPEPRIFHTTVWTGSHMLVWGGVNAQFGELDTGARYDPATDTWSSISMSGAPEARWGHTAVWTGAHMIVWGGGGNFEYLNTGGSYDPLMDTWTPTSTIDAPEARSQHAAVWTGQVMVVWGGTIGSHEVDTGGRYDPDSDSWTATSIAGAPPASESPTAVWTGQVMVVWGGLNYSTIPGSSHIGMHRTGARYDPATDRWTSTSLADAPAARAFHTAVWTGREMIVWGGEGECRDVLSGCEHLDSGARYDPVSDSWRPTSFRKVPVRRDAHSAVWTGRRMLVWGGRGGPRGSALSTGAAYNPVTDSWAPLSTYGAPGPRSLHTAMWTGREMLIWGGLRKISMFSPSAVGRYDPGRNRWSMALHGPVAGQDR